VANPQTYLGANLQAWSFYEHVERVGDSTVGRVLQRDDAEMHVTPVDLFEDGRNRADGHVLDPFAELGDRGDLR